METNIGNFTLTINQQSHLTSLKDDIVTGYGYFSETGKLVVISDSPLSGGKISSITASVNAFPDTPSQQSIITKFDTNLMLGAMGLTFTGADAVNLAPYLSAIQNYADFRNFGGIKNFIAGLVSLGKATQEQSDSLYAIFAEQGINLGDF